MTTPFDIRREAAEKQVKQANAFAKNLYVCLQPEEFPKLTVADIQSLLKQSAEGLMQLSNAVSEALGYAVAVTKQTDAAKKFVAASDNPDEWQSRMPADPTQWNFRRWLQARFRATTLTMWDNETAVAYYQRATELLQEYTVDFLQQAYKWDRSPKGGQAADGRKEPGYCKYCSKREEDGVNQVRPAA